MALFTRQDFLSPDVKFAPVYSWGWNSPIEADEIRRQMREMCDNGIRGVYVLPSPAEFGFITSDASGLTPEYMSDEYMQLMRVVVDTAEELGMALWLYDEGGFPSGSVCTQINQKKPGLARKLIYSTHFPLHAGIRYYPPVSQAGFLTAFARLGEGAPARVSDAFTPEEEVVITEFYTKELLNPTGGPTFGTDIADPEVGRMFLEMTHDKYAAVMGEKFGSFIPLMFDDEPHLHYPYPWTPGLDKLFKERYGYDMLDFLPWITRELPWQTDAQRQAIIDYRLLICERVLHSFFLPIRKWCEEHNIASAGHLGGEHVIDLLITEVHSYGNPMEILRSFHIPGVDAIWGQIYPGNTANEPRVPDKPCVPFFPRLASSAAAQTGQMRSLTESMAIYGDGTTPDLIRYVIGFQAVRGINMFNLMSINYDKTGFSPLSNRPLFEPFKPGHRHLRAVNEYMGRLSYLTQLGPTECRAALYLPVNDLLVGEPPENYYALGNALEAQHIDFDIVDDALIRKSSVENGCLCAGLRAYSRIYVPEGARVPEDVAEKIAPLCTGDVAPVFACEINMLRGQKRILPDGSALYLIFNEDEKTVEDTVHIADNRPAYRLSMEDGKIYASPGCRQKVTLQSGEIVALLFTEADVAVDAPAGETAWELPLGPFTLHRTQQFRITPEGARSTPVAEAPQIAELGAWTERFGHEFSGEAIYRCEVDLPEAPLPTDRYELDLGEVEYTADVTIDGQPSGIAALSPFVVELTGAQLKKHSIIEIRVANTAANQCVTADIRSFWPERYIPGYHSHSLAFEHEKLGGGLIGPVVLRKK